MNFFKFCRQFRLLIRFVLLSVLTLLLVSNLIPLAVAQIPYIGEESQTKPNSIPKEVIRYGEIEVTWVKSPIDNKPLIEIASLTVYNRDQPESGQTPVEVRAKEIRDRIWRYITRIDKERTSSTVSLAFLNQLPIIQVQDNLNSRPLKLVTVTELDSDYHGKPVEELSQEWQKTLQEEIERIDRLLSMDVLKQSFVEAFGIFLGMLITSGIIWVLYGLLKKRDTFVREKYGTKPESSQLVTPESSSVDDINEKDAQTFTTMRSQLTSIFHNQLSLKTRLEVINFLKWLLFWLFILIWYGGIFAIFSRIPVLMRYKGWILSTPLELVIIWFFISFAIRISTSIIIRLIKVWENSSFPLSLGETERKTLRSTTLAGALEGLAKCILITIGIVATLNQFRIPIGSIIAVGAILGLALSFGAQSLVKDLVNGCLILAEDQFAVGDIVTIGTEGGLVENLNLRITQLRNSAGQLITIPNSSITQVKNLTRLWSRVDFTIEVAYENDPKQVLTLLSQIAEQMYSETEWNNRIIEPPEVLGIDQLSHSGMLIRVWFKTLPMEQWSVGREYRYRVRIAFEENNIQIGRPQWITYNNTLENEKMFKFPAN